MTALGDVEKSKYLLEEQLILPVEVQVKRRCGGGCQVPATPHPAERQ